MALFSSPTTKVVDVNISLISLIISKISRKNWVDLTAKYECSAALKFSLGGKKKQKIQINC